MCQGVKELRQNCTGETPGGPGSGLYVDVENLQGTNAAQEVIKSLLESWPSAAPSATRLNLYVRADHSLLWEVWAEDRFPNINVSAKGVQHFSNNPTKNSADIAMAIDAIADILLGRISYVVVVSDDSDFISLYSKLREEQHRIGYTSGDIPFLWALTDRPNTRSSTLKDYFPKRHIHEVPFPKETKETVAATKEVKDNPSEESPAPANATDAPYAAMARAIIEKIPVGRFKSTDCQKIIKAGWPKYPLATTSQESFGAEFRKKLWPILESLGVSEPNPDSKPRQYEMTQKAKDSIK